MKTKQIFWGVFLISIGILILLSGYIEFECGFGDLWKLWPLFIVLIGINLMLKNTTAKAILSGLTALVLAFTLFASVISFFGWIKDDVEFQIDHENTFDVSNYSTEFEKGIKNASLHVEAGAGAFTINDTTSFLFTADVEGKNSSYSLTSDIQESNADLNFKMKSRKFFIKRKNRVEMKLNPVPVWDLKFDMGAVAADFDVSGFNVRKLDIQMGAASLVLKLGSINAESHINIDAGASSIEISIPEDAGCEIKADASLSSKEFIGFTKISEHLYKTKDFDAAKKKIYLDIDSGISSIKVSRSAW